MMSTDEVFPERGESANHDRMLCCGVPPAVSVVSEVQTVTGVRQCTHRDPVHRSRGHGGYSEKKFATVFILCSAALRAIAEGGVTVPRVRHVVASAE